MKAFVALMCILIISVEAGSARKRHAHITDDKGDQDRETQWPNPDTINNFPVPESFADATGGATEGIDDAETMKTQASHGRHKPHRFQRE